MQEVTKPQLERNPSGNEHQARPDQASRQAHVSRNVIL